MLLKRVYDAILARVRADTATTRAAIGDEAEEMGRDLAGYMAQRMAGGFVSECGAIEADLTPVIETTVRSLGDRISDVVGARTKAIRVTDLAVELGEERDVIADSLPDDVSLLRGGWVRGK